MPSVRLPRPMEVKKLTEKRVFLGWSSGKSPEKGCVMRASEKRAFSVTRPNASLSS